MALTLGASCTPSQAKTSSSDVSFQNRTDVIIVESPMVQPFVIESFAYEVTQLDVDAYITPVVYSSGKKLTNNDCVSLNDCYCYDGGDIRAWCNERAFANLILTKLKQNEQEQLIFNVGSNIQEDTSIPISIS